MTSSKIELIIISLIVIFLISCGKYEDKASITASGTIEAKEVDVSAQMGGRIVSMNVEEGDVVQKGQVLAEIEHKKLDIQLRHARRNAIELIQAQIDDATIKAPIAGIVTTKVFYIGEFVSPGVPVVSITNLDSIYLTIFVPENKLGKVKFGQRAQVSVDSFPEKTFTGKVTYISPEAEFTPKNIQTKEERVKLVYGVKIKLENPDGLLKPGMPADAVLKF